MKLVNFEEEDEDVWAVDDVQLAGGRAPVRVTYWSEIGPPNDTEIAGMEGVLSEVEAFVLKAAPLILENYERDYFAKLGVPDDQLPQETPEAIAAAAILGTISFYDVADGDFELSFSMPWDDHHSFDVEFDGHEATTCAVNG